MEVCRFMERMKWGHELDMLGICKVIKDEYPIIKRALGIYKET